VSLLFPVLFLELAVLAAPCVPSDLCKWRTRKTLGCFQGLVVMKSSAPKKISRWMPLLTGFYPRLASTVTWLCVPQEHRLVASPTGSSLRRHRLVTPRNLFCTKLLSSEEVQLRIKQASCWRLVAWLGWVNTCECGVYLGVCLGANTCVCVVG
jgi:hypothetical protein